MFLHGQFLIAANHLRDPNFYRTVVLMLEHNAEGAMGLVVNRPSSIAVDAALSGQIQGTKCQSPIFVGGPVENSALFILHNSVAIGAKDQEVAPGVFLSGSHESFETVVRESDSGKSAAVFRVYCGYAGWGAGQLESEIERGDWRNLPATDAIVLEEDPYGIWEVCTRKLQRANRLLPHNVRNPEWN
ncbi:MAG: YqgE/AlgH family protein [Planctomycetaceae bacterium]